MPLLTVWPTDAADGSVANEARWRKMGRVWAPSGVVAGQGSEMLPTYASGSVTVRAGACWVDGHYCELASTQSVTVTATGIVVVRFDPAANTADLLYRDGVTTPSQSPTGTWELLIASMSGSVMTDRRGRLINPAELAALVDRQPKAWTVTGIAGTSGGTFANIQVLTVPAQTVAGTVLAWSFLRLDIGTITGAYTVNLQTGATVLAIMRLSAASSVNTFTLSASIPTTPGVATNVNVAGAGTANVTTYAQANVNRLEALFVPTFLP